MKLNLTFCLQLEEKDLEEKERSGDDVVNANQSPETEFDRDREVMSRCVKLILQGQSVRMPAMTPKVIQ